jgi:hypothetical protein
MAFPAFYDKAPRIQMRDPLSDLLGASEKGLIEYSYEDAVRLAGHSCPTVAGTWLMLARGLKHLYADGAPERGAIWVKFPEPQTSGVTGVMAAIATLVTGATLDAGFKGLAGQFDRRGLLFFSAPVKGSMSLERTDTGASATLLLDTSSVPAPPDMGHLLGQCLGGQASPEDRRRFGELWQERVRLMLTEMADDPRLVTVLG